MEDRVIHFLIQLGKLGTFSFGLLTALNSFRYVALLIEPALDFAYISRNKQWYLGNVVKVIGKADGVVFDVRKK